jgi:hypothetical protein
MTLIFQQQCVCTPIAFTICTSTSLQVTKSEVEGPLFALGVAPMSFTGLVIGSGTAELG